MKKSFPVKNLPRRISCNQNRMLTGRAAPRVYRIIPQDCDKAMYGYVRRCVNHNNFPIPLIQMMLVYGYLFETVEPIIKCIIVSYLSNDKEKTKIMLDNLKCILINQERKNAQQHEPWPSELLKKLSYVNVILFIIIIHHNRIQTVINNL